MLLVCIELDEMSSLWWVKKLYTSAYQHISIYTVYADDVLWYAKMAEQALGYGNAMYVIVIPWLPWDLSLITTPRPEGVVINNKSWQPWYKCYVSYLVG